MNRRRFMKLFGAAAAAGAVPAIAGADAAIAYAEKQPVQVESVFQRLVDTMAGLRRPLVDLGASGRSAALAAAEFEQAMTSVAQQSGDPLFCDPLTIEKLEATIKLIAQQSAVPIDLTPQYIVMTPERAREIARAHGIKVEERRQDFEAFLIDRISTATGSPVPVLTDPYCPPDQIIIADRYTLPYADPIHELGTWRDVRDAGYRHAETKPTTRTVESDGSGSLFDESFGD